MIGSQSLLLVLGVVLLLFGGKKLPELAGSLGRSMKEFKKSVEEGESAGTPARPAEPAAASGGRACPRCRTALQAGWVHCPGCGTPTEAAATPPAAAADTPPPTA